MRPHPWIAAVAALAACSETVSSPNAELASPSALAQVGRRLLVANTNGADLRALALEPGGRVFVRAPNPLFPLSLPTTPYPRALAAFTSDDGETAAPFAFALSTAAAQVSVLAAEELKLLGTLALPGVPLSVAVAAPRPGVATRLVVGIAQNGLGALHVAALLPSLARDPSLIGSVALAPAVQLGRSQPQALAASRAHPDLMVVGDRLTFDDGMGRSGGLALVDLRTGSVERHDVGGPVLALSLARADAEQGRGERVFGVLDAQACGEAPCGGVFAFDLDTRSLLPAPGLGPIEIPGVARGIAAGGTAVVTVPGLDAPLSVSPLVLVTSTDGKVYLVDGGLGRVVDVERIEPAVAAQSRVEPDGASGEPVNGPAGIRLARGATRGERVTLTWEGRLPGLTSRKGRLVGGALEDERDFVALGARPGDRVVFEDATVACEAPVATVAPGVLGLGVFDPVCVPAGPLYSVRATAVFAVVGGRSGLMGRVAPGAEFAFQGRYFFAADGFDPARPALAFTMGSGEPLARELRYTLDLTSGVSPFGVPISSLHMPGAVAHDPKLNLFFVVYQGGGRVVEMTPADLRSADPSSGLRAYQ